MKEDILVSICCITYNHQEYIREALEGFLMQKTNFKYEVIIYDDASTDSTTEIIKLYEEKYPQIIKPIYSKENQYSKGMQTFDFTFQKAKGKYIALCEGDDYWIDENKLQKQVDYMENHTECTFCFHNANILYMKNKNMETYLTSKTTYKKYISKDGNYDASNIHLLGMGGIPTASFMFRAKYIDKIPDFFYGAVCGDMPLKLIMTGFGYAHYIDEVMAVYRRETGMSVTDKWRNEQDVNVEKRVNHVNKLIKIIDDFNIYSNHKFEKGLKISREFYRIEKYCAEGKYKEIINDSKLKKYYKIRFNDRMGIKLFIKAYLPKIYILIKNRRIKNGK